jgi:hypothetical protein
MYYDQKEVQAHLKCSICSHNFDDPRILPCGITICYECIERCSGKNKTIFNCKHCKSIHPIPIDGFIKNINLANLIGLKPFNISRGTAINSFKLELDKIHDEIKLFERILDEGNIFFFEKGLELFSRQIFF